MESLARRNQTKAVVVDPTILNTRERLKVFLESMIFKEYSSFLPSAISSLIKEGKWDELVALLRQWEWNLDSRKSEEWFNSYDFKDLCKQLNEVCISYENIEEELSQSERKTLSIVRDILGPESPILVDLAKELVTIATTKQAGIVSFTRHLKRWLKSLRGVLILEISEKTSAISAAKADIKKRFRDAKRKGKVFVTFLSIVATVALTGVLPSGFNWVLGTILTSLGEKVIVGLIINGIS